MKEQLQQNFKGFTSRWEQLSFNQKIIVGTLVGALIFSGFFIIQKANENYSVLYTDMSVSDAANITARLKEDGIKFKIADGGATILVPTGQQDELRLTTANDLQDGVRLDKIPPVGSKEVQAQYLKQLTRQSIEAALRKIRGIKNSQVLIARPEHNVFIESSEPVRASVLLEVVPGFRLREEQVKTIRNLVSHAVPGLLAENVAIADSSGNPLEGPGGILLNGQSEADIRKQKFEEDVTKKVRSILIPLVGQENVQVSVSAMLNFDQAESEIHRVIPSGGTSAKPTGLAVSSQTQTEEYTGGKKPEGGAAGVESNIPSYQGPGQDKAKDATYTSTKTTTNYEISREHKTVLYAPGTVERMTVAVVLNKVLTERETAEIRELVENAAGIDMARGDSVTIQGYQFSQIPENQEDALQQAAEEAQQQAFYIQLASIAAVVLLGLAALGVFLFLFRKPAEGELVEDVEEYVFEEPEQLLEEAPIPVIEAKLDPEIEHMRESINNMVASDPEEAARVLVTFMKDM